MNRSILLIAFLGLCAAGCGNSANNSANSNANKTSNAPASIGITPAANQRAPVNSTPSTSLTADESVETADTDVTGGYLFKDKLPAEFAELDFLGLATIDENAKPAPLNGFLRPKKQSAADYKLVSPKLDGKNLTFTTAAVGGISYSFTGAFKKLGNFAEKPPQTDEIILSGTLTKIKDGAKVADAKVDFVYEKGD